MAKQLPGKLIGEFKLPLSIEGVYKVALVDENGDVAAETSVKSLAKPAPSEESKPTEEKGGEDCSWLFLALLLAAAVVFIVYRAGGGQSAKPWRTPGPFSLPHRP
jgi:hypothetical protein